MDSRRCESMKAALIAETPLKEHSASLQKEQVASSTAAWSPASASTATGGDHSTRSIGSTRILEAGKETRADDDRVAREFRESDFRLPGEEDLEANEEAAATTSECTAAAAVAACQDAAVDPMHAECEERVYWEGFFVVLPVFAGYATLFGLQHEVKTRFGIGDNSSAASHAFSFAVSFQFIFNLIFRPGHNIIFCMLSARKRVFAAMTFMMIAMLILSVVIMILEQHHIGFVILAYSCGGVAIGTFECNFLSCITPLGHGTKHRAIVAIPVGIASVLIGGFFTIGPPFHVPVAAIYITVAFMLFFGMLVMAKRIPDVPLEKGARQASLGSFVSDLKQFRKWLPQIWHYPLAGTIDMFTLSCFSPGVLLYIYDGKTVELAPGFAIPTDSFMAIFNLFNMMGGLTGRAISYRMKPRHPIVYTVVNIAGVALCLTRIPLLAPIGTFLVMMGDGFIYGALAKHIDMNVPKEFNLTAFSFRFVMSDIGSVVGSNSISFVRDLVVGN